MANHSTFRYPCQEANFSVPTVKPWRDKVEIKLTGGTMDFADWLDAEIKRRGIKAADLARGSGLSHSVITRILKRERIKPTPETCTGIAKAFNMDPKDVMRAAGILSPSIEELAIGNTTLRETIEALRYMTLGEMKDVLSYIMFLRSKRKN